jgi:hypothetical protein
MVNYYLPNKVMIPMLRVTEAPLHDIDILIGMDIISQGDFIVTNYQGKTKVVGVVKTRNFEESDGKNFLEIFS